MNEPRSNVDCICGSIENANAALWLTCSALLRHVYSPVFHVRVIRLAIRPLWIAYDAVVAVGQDQCVCGVEQQIGAGQKNSDHPDDTSNAEGRTFAHSRS